MKATCNAAWLPQVLRWSVHWHFRMRTNLRGRAARRNPRTEFSKVLKGRNGAPGAKGKSWSKVQTQRIRSPNDTSTSGLRGSRKQWCCTKIHPRRPAFKRQGVCSWQVYIPFVTVKSILRKVCWGHCVPRALVTLCPLGSTVHQGHTISIRQSCWSGSGPLRMFSSRELLIPSLTCLLPNCTYILLEHEFYFAINSYLLPCL